MLGEFNFDRALDREAYDESFARRLRYAERDWYAAYSQSPNHPLVRLYPTASRFVAAVERAILTGTYTEYTGIY